METIELYTKFINILSRRDFSYDRRPGPMNMGWDELDSIDAWSRELTLEERQALCHHIESEILANETDWVETKRLFLANLLGGLTTIYNYDNWQFALSQIDFFIAHDKLSDTLNSLLGVIASHGNEQVLPILKRQRMVVLDKIKHDFSNGMIIEAIYELIIKIFNRSILKIHGVAELQNFRDYVIMGMSLDSPSVDIVKSFLWDCAKLVEKVGFGAVMDALQQGCKTLDSAERQFLVKKLKEYSLYSTSKYSDIKKIALALLDHI